MLEPYIIKVDTREKLPWTFPITTECAGIQRIKVDTGDYTLLGLEASVAIERKKNTSELINNFMEKRFEREFERLEEIKYPFLICEFTWEDVLLFPLNSGIPKYLWHRVQINSDYLRACITRVQCKYKTKWIFAGKFGQAAALNIFHYIWKYGEK